MNFLRPLLPGALLALSSLTIPPGSARAEPTPARTAAPSSYPVHYQTVPVAGVNVFYREAGPKDAPTILLLHGFPTSSHMFRNLIPALADRYHLVAPDYPGYGNSDAPPADRFAYTFDHLAEVVDAFTQAVGLDRYTLYVQDYGAPVGYRLATRHPERVSGLIVQNGNAYEEGLPDSFWKPVRAYWADHSDAHAAPLKDVLKLPATKWQYTQGVSDVSLVDPDAWQHDQALLDRPGQEEIQLALFYSYGSNPPLYPRWQEYFRRHQPPTLIVWGKNDPIFPASGATPYLRDLPKAELHLLDTGHFALEEDGAEIARLIGHFMETKVRPAAAAARSPEGSEAAHR